MTCEECSKCWFNYIEECGGQSGSFKKNKCKKQSLREEDEEAEGSKEQLKNVI